MNKYTKLEIVRNKFNEMKDNKEKDQEFKNRRYAQLMTELEADYQMNLLDANDNDPKVLELYLEISNERDFTNY